MKKRSVLIASIATIAVCLSLAVGATWALFTSNDTVNITVSSGKVDVVSTLTDAKVYAGTVNRTTFEVTDYAEVTDGTRTAAVTGEGKVLTVNGLIPGDYAEFTLDVRNAGTVSANYQYEFTCTDGYYLMYGLQIKVEKVSTQNTVMFADSAVKHYVSPWTTGLDKGQTDTYKVTVTLPANSGNDYENKSTSIETTVYAVQGNAAVDTTAFTLEKLDAALTAENFAETQKGGKFVLEKDVTLDAAFVYGNDVVTEIDLNGYTLQQNGVRLTANGNAELTLKNGKYVSTGYNQNMGTATVNGQKAELGIGVINTASMMVSNEASLTLENVDYECYGGIYVAAVAGKLYVKGGTITNTNPMSAAISTNNTSNYHPVIEVADAKIISAGTGIMMNLDGVMTIDRCDITANFQCVQVRGGKAVIKNGTKLTNKASKATWDGFYAEGGAWAQSTPEQKANNMTLHKVYTELFGSDVKPAINDCVEAWQAGNAVMPGCVVIGNYGGKAANNNAGYRNDSQCEIADDTVFAVEKGMDEHKIVIAGHGDAVHTAKVTYTGTAGVTVVQTSQIQNVYVNGRAQA